jgi:hypothetical protein
MHSRSLLRLSIVLLLLFSGCIVQPQQDVTGAEQKEQPASPPAAETQPTPTQGPVVVTRCEDTDGQNTDVKGKAVLYYSDGTKESLGDYCLKEDPTFVIEYFCDGIAPKTKNVRCDDSCVKGVCI